VLALDHLPQPQGWSVDHYLQADLELLVKDDTYAGETVARLRNLLDGRGLNVLINNAAVQLLGGLQTLRLADLQRSLNVNLLAPFVLTQGMLSQLEAARGCVINISSIHANLTKPRFVAYATSKAALSGMTRAMAVDLGGRVRVNAIEPAAISTDLLNAGFDEMPALFSQLENCHPQGRIGTPAEVAALALCMASGELRFLHGACVAMDGGIGVRLHDPD
jgi:NAD(P)-dependent dehydrogenase (short-subunit alcohol dehydrogenase family)